MGYTSGYERGITRRVLSAVFGREIGTTRRVLSAVFGRREGILLGIPPGYMLGMYTLLYVPVYTRL